MYKDTKNSDEPVKLNPKFDLRKPETFVNHFQELKKELEVEKREYQNNKFFKMMSANQWIEESKNTPIPSMLFGEFWHENELCVLFADTNLGKSILAVQIGNGISRGTPVLGLKMESKNQKVAYFDFELSEKQFEARYSIKKEGKKVFEQHYTFDDNFKRVEINSDAIVPEEIDYDELVILSMERIITESKIKVLIIDNLTYLKNETEKAKNALPLMKRLKELKKKYNLSILILAHTPKRDLSRPISQNDLQGSKMLINFVDSCFAIGSSYSDKVVRYLKQIKARNTEIVYDASNVLTCQIHKEKNFLSFDFIGYGIESEHLKQFSEKDRNDLIDKAKELSHKGLSQRKISSELGISLGAVNKYLKL